MNIDKKGTLYRMASRGSKCGDVGYDICTFSRNAIWGFLLFVFMFGLLELYLVSILTTIAVIVQYPSSFHMMANETVFGLIAIWITTMACVVASAIGVMVLLHEIHQKFTTTRSDTNSTSFLKEWYNAKKGKYCTKLTFK